MITTWLLRTLLFCFFLLNTSCVIDASIVDLNKKNIGSNLVNNPETKTLDKVFVDLTQVTLTEGSIAVINVAVNPVRSVDTVINLSLTSSSTYVRFNPIPTQITIPAGMTSKSVVINTIDDSLVEAQEIWQFTISPQDASLQTDPGTLVITLNDNDGGYIPSNTPAVPIPLLLKEFNLTPVSIPSIEYNNKVIYQGSDATNGKELWISDGTSLGTYLLKDINPGLNSSDPTSFYKDENSTYVYFIAKTPSEGAELWRTDGTPSGTILLKDIEPGVSDSSIAFLYTKGSLVYFRATDSTYGTEIYTTDGSISETRLLKDMVPGSQGITNGASEFVFFNNILYVSIIDPVSYTSQLWKTDGTPAGTTFVLNSTASGATFKTSGIYGFDIINGKLIFTSNVLGYGTEMFYTDGISPAGTDLLKDIYSSNLSSYTVSTGIKVNSKSLLKATVDSNASIGLWLTDGTPAGTTKISTSANLQNVFGSINSKIIFSGTTNISETELWATDGTTAGTVLIKDINPGTASSNPYVVGQIGNIIYLVAYTNSEGSELWRTDGTTAGTFLLKDINPGNQASNAANFKVINSKLVFTAYSPTLGTELWMTDGTTIGTTLVKDIFPGVKSSGPKGLVSINNSSLFFAAYNPITQFPTIFFSDLTTNGTVGIPHALVESGNTNTIQFHPFNGLVYFDAIDDSNGNSLWVTDGTTANTNKIKDLNPNIVCTDISTIYDFNGSMFFSATSADYGNEIHISDGTSAGTTLLKDIESGTTSGTGGVTITPNTSGSKFFFTATTTTYGTEPWVSDGTSAGTFMLKDLYSGNFSSGANTMTVVPGTDEILFLAQKTNDARYYLFRSDGTTANTLEVTGLGTPGDVAKITKGANALLIKSSDTSVKYRLFRYEYTTKTLTLLNSTYTTDIMIGGVYYNPRLNLFFYVTTNSSYSTLNLWKTDGTVAGTTLVKNIPMSGLSFTLGGFQELGNKLIFSYSNITSIPFVFQIWETDGTPAGTNLVKDLTGLKSMDLASGVVFNDKAFFAAYDDTNGVELWMTDGTSSGTGLLKDMFPGTGNGSPKNFKVFNGKLYFAASDDSHGEELWRTDGAPGGTEMVYDINPGPLSSSPSLLTPIGGTLYFKATKILSGQENWVYTP